MASDKDSTTAPRPLTEDEMKERFMRLLLASADQCAREPKTPQEQCRGLAFSILATFDGSAADFPAIDLVLRPHGDDKEYHRDLGENWIEDGTVINERAYLHEEWNDFVRRVEAEG